MTLEIINQDFSLCKIERLNVVDFHDPFCFVGKTDEEISLVCSTPYVPKEVIERVDGYKALRIQGMLDFSMVGILAEIASLLAENQISIFAISTYNTDYILIRENQFYSALKVLGNEGYHILV